MTVKAPARWLFILSIGMVIVAGIAGCSTSTHQSDASQPASITPQQTANLPSIFDITGSFDQPVITVNSRRIEGQTWIDSGSMQILYQGTLNGITEIQFIEKTNYMTGALSRRGSGIFTGTVDGRSGTFDCQETTTGQLYSYGSAIRGSAHYQTTFAVTGGSGKLEGLRGLITGSTETLTSGTYSGQLGFDQEAQSLSAAALAGMDNDGVTETSDFTERSIAPSLDYFRYFRHQSEMIYIRPGNSISITLTDYIQGQEFRQWERDVSFINGTIIEETDYATSTVGSEKQSTWQFHATAPGTCLITFKAGLFGSDISSAWTYTVALAVVPEGAQVVPVTFTVEQISSQITNERIMQGASYQTNLQTYLTADSLQGIWERKDEFAFDVHLGVSWTEADSSFTGLLNGKEGNVTLHGFASGIYTRVGVKVNEFGQEFQYWIITGSNGELSNVEGMFSRTVPATTVDSSADPLYEYTGPYSGIIWFQD